MSVPRTVGSQAVECEFHVTVFSSQAVVTRCTRITSGVEAPMLRLRSAETMVALAGIDERSNAISPRSVEPELSPAYMSAPVGV
ncbi:hypothetical protein WME79_10855 [Sorangium sp. So ce726]